jgi:hypothetical protein
VFEYIISFAAAALPLVFLFIFSKPKKKLEDKKEITSNSIRLLLALNTVVLVIPLIVFEVHFTYIVFMVITLNIFIPSAIISAIK